MHYTTIAETTLRPSVLCLGTADMGTKIERELSFQILDDYLAHGGNFLDTAAVYSDWVPGERRRVEKLLGEWLRQRGGRDQVILATKGAHPELATMHISRMAPDDIVQDIQLSLQSLRTDVIDLFWLHRDDVQRPVGDILETLNTQVKAGSIRYFGCSNWTTARIKAAQAYVTAHRLQGFVGNQMLWNVGVPDPNAIADKTIALMDQAMHTYHTATGLAAIPYTAQANGLFHKLAANRLDPKSGQVQVYHLPQNGTISQRIQEIATANGQTITQVVLGYLLSQPFTTIPIIGCRSLAQLDDSLAAADVRLDAASLKLLQEGRGW